MKNKENIYETLTGKDRDKIPDIAFKVMTFIMKLFDFFGNHSNKKFKTLGLKEGQTVVDYGCGPARYIKNASECVGDKGKVLAVDVHPLAIENVQHKIKNYNLQNVEAVLANGYSTSIDSNTADMVYALDMFHMVEKPSLLLQELHRIVKPDGVILIEDGHQSRTKTLQKINDFGLLTITESNKYHVKCKKA